MCKALALAAQQSRTGSTALPQQSQHSTSWANTCNSTLWLSNSSSPGLEATFDRRDILTLKAVADSTVDTRCKPLTGVHWWPNVNNALPIQWCASDANSWHTLAHLFTLFTLSSLSPQLRTLCVHSLCIGFALTLLSLFAEVKLESVLYFLSLHINRRKVCQPLLALY